MEAGHNCSILLRVEGVMAGLRIMVGLKMKYLQTKVGAFRASLIPDGFFNFFEPLRGLFSLFSPLSAEQCRYIGSVSQWADAPHCASVLN